MNNIFQTLLYQREKQKDTVLATIVWDDGSAPRGAGSQMLVGAEGLLSGTIGGGAVERQSILLARELLKGKRNALRDFALHPEAANSTGMVCGGDVTAHFQFIPAEDPLWNDTASRALALLEQHTAAEAARLCGRPQKTVEAQVYRAKKMLAAQLRASGAEAPQKPERRNQNG